MKTKIQFSCLLILFISFASCRKGKEDPLISLHSRTARLAGNWTIINYDENQEIEYIYPNGKKLLKTFNRNYGTVNYQETTSDTANTSVIYNGKVSKTEFHFSQDGEWNSLIEYYVYVPQSVGGYYISKTRYEEEGTWEFKGKGDGFKNKESMEVKTLKSNKFNYTYSSYLGTVVDSVADSAYYVVDRTALWKLIGLSNSRLNAEITSTSSAVSTIPGLIGTQINTKTTTEIRMMQ